ncbi:thioredoxin family protein [Thalassospira sp. MA62]|nr:thioredoxin family protein [Thalassospira sp. MA62]
MYRHLPARFVLLVVFALTAFGAFRSAHAADDMVSPWIDEDFASVRLISAQTRVTDGGTARLGLEFELQPDWKIYWRSAGDAGFPPQLDWEGSENVGDAEILWPAPHRFSIFGLETFGYKDHIILPIDVAIPDPAQSVAINLNVDYLVCSDICIPASGTFNLDLSPSADGAADGGSAVTNQAHQIEKFVSKVPLRGDQLPIEATSLSFRPDSTSPALRVAINGLDTANVTLDDIIVENDLRLGFGSPIAIETRNDGATKIFDLPVQGLQADHNIVSEPVTVTVIAGPLSVEQDMTIGQSSDGASDAAQGTITGTRSGSDGMSAILPASENGLSQDVNIWLIGLFALFGGLILNVMPCVLPVLSIKVMSAVKARESELSHVRRGFLASAAGIITSFWLIAAALIAVKLAGGAVGWGIQFQQPLFLTVMTIILALFALNMWGMFEIGGASQLENAANDAITKQESRGHHLSGHFLSGMFATLLATPCSAPFLGTAVGFALAGSNFDIIWVFTLLGIGLSLPYLAIAIQPRLAHLLPRPGRWMNIVKAVLGLALVGTAIWLLMVLSVQIGITGAAVIGGGLILGGVFAFARHRTANLKPRFTFTALSILAFLVALFAPGFIAPPASNATSQSGPIAGQLEWQDFAPETIADHVANGQTVLVDITADWCVTCQVNKKLVLETDDVAAALNQDHIILMQGDWTRPDQDIADYLASYGRYGIPFNAVFGPGAPQGILLSELLSKDDVLSALRTAGSRDQLANN